MQPRSRAPAEIGAGHLGPDGTVVELRDEVDIEHLCGPLHYVGYFVTLGLLWVVDDLVASKTGEPVCPTTETTYDHARRVTLAVTTSAPPREVHITLPACVFAGPDEGCVTDRSSRAIARGPREVPAGLPPTLHVLATSPDRRLVVAHRAAYGPCAIATVADLHEIPISACEDVRFADNHTLLLPNPNGMARLLDADTGAELGRGDRPTWLGGGLAAVWRNSYQIDIVERDGFRSIATIDVKAAIEDAGALLVIGSSSIVAIRPGARPVRIALPFQVAGVLDARGDLALVRLRSPRSRPPEVAVIRLSTGQLVSRLAA